MNSPNYSVDSIIENALRFILDNTKIIKGIYKQISYNDEPKLYGYGVNFNNNSGNSENEEAGAGGLSFNKKKALLKTLGETIERFSLSNNNDSKLIYSTFKELVKLNKSALDPQSLVLFAKKYRYIKNLNTSNFHWVEGKFLLSGKKIFVPAQLVYVPYIYQDTEPVLQFPLSTGAAAGTDLSNALYRGICEVVERDSFMIAYLNKIPSPHINLSSINDRLIHTIIETVKRYNLELEVLDLTTNLQIPSFAAIIVDRTGIGPSVAVGLKAGFNINNTIIGAIEESLMVRFYTRDKILHKKSDTKNNEVTTIEERAHFWFPKSRIKDLDFWLNHKVYKKINYQQIKSSENYLRDALKLLHGKGIDIIYIDITDKLVKKYGFTVVKVIIPQLQPLFLDERYPLIQPNRVFNVPVEMGLFPKPKLNSQLNKVPHPFL